MKKIATICLIAGLAKAWAASTINSTALIASVPAAALVQGSLTPPGFASQQNTNLNTTNWSAPSETSPTTARTSSSS